MYGPTVGSLNVWLRQGGQLTRQIWSKTGNLGNKWRLGQVTIKSDFDFEVVLEGVVGTSYTGDAAVDDIEMIAGECDAEASCDFETGYCGYYNTFEGDNFDWLRNKGDTDSFATGPIVDVSTGTKEGYYVFIEASYPQKQGDKAWLVSEVLQTPNGACLNWYAHMYGSSIGNLTVYQRITDKAPVALWTSSVISSF